jgi:hypothetical protein
MPKAVPAALDQAEIRVLGRKLQPHQRQSPVLLPDADLTENSKELVASTGRRVNQLRDGARVPAVLIQGLGVPGRAGERKVAGEVPVALSQTCRIDRRQSLPVATRRRAVLHRAVVLWGRSGSEIQVGSTNFRTSATIHDLRKPVLSRPTSNRRRGTTAERDCTNIRSLFYRRKEIFTSPAIPQTAVRERCTCVRAFDYHAWVGFRRMRLLA